MLLLVMFDLCLIFGSNLMDHALHMLEIINILDSYFPRVYLLLLKKTKMSKNLLSW